MKFGKLDLGNKLLVAPMAEITDTAFRKIAKDYGAGMTFTQMVSAEGVLKNNFDTLRYLVFSRSEKPIGVQVLGKDPDILHRAVRDLVSFQPDVIDLNSGCPVEKVCKFKMGAGLLDDTENLGKLVSSMVKAAEGIPVSVKLRLGKNRNNINIVENAKICEDNGVSHLVIHARARTDKYNASPMFEWIAKVKDAVSIPVIVNGSLFTPADIFRVIKETGADSAMIARGALGNPFLFRRYNELCQNGIDPGEPEVDEIKDVSFKHLEYLLAEHEEKLAVNKIKKHIIWYFRRNAGVEFLIERVFSIGSENELKDLIELHVEKLKSGSYNKDTVEITNKKFNDRVVFWTE